MRHVRFQTFPAVMGAAGGFDGAPFLAWIPAFTPMSANRKNRTQLCLAIVL